MGLEKIEQLKKEKGLTNEELAKLSGVPKATIDKITSGTTKDPKLETVKAIARALNCTIDDFDDFYPVRNFTTEEWSHIQKYRSLDDHGKVTVDYIIQRELFRMEQIQTAERISAEKSDNIIYLKHAVQKASAGTGFLLGDEHMDPMPVILNDLTRRADFCVDVDGRSMEPLYHDGDTVLIREQPSVELGQIGLYIKDGKGYIKRQGEGRVESVNTGYADVEPEEFIDIRCIGRVIGILSPAWIREFNR